MKSFFQGIQYFLVALLLVITAGASYAQTTVSGTITDGTTGEPLPGATVRVDGTSTGAVTDVDGKYTLTTNDPDATLVASFVGYLEEKIALDGRTEVDIVLMQSIEMLSEMVVIGYGTAKKSDLTGSISVVTAEDMNRIPTSNFTQALQGRASGVMVTQTGNPGQNAQIMIRGVGSINRSSDPVYVIDGVITGSLNSVNPTDIESVQVLKDASAAAIYGADGANGVIIITTKRGESGATRVSYSSYASINRVPKQFELLNADEYADFYNQVLKRQFEDNNPGETFTPPIAYTDQFRQWYYGDGWETGTNWQDQIVRNAMAQNHNIRISGGGESSNYSISANYYAEDGISLGSSAERINLRANSDFELGDYVTIGESFSVTRSMSQRPEIYGWGNSLIASPLMKVYNPDNKEGFEGPQVSYSYILPDGSDTLDIRNTGGNDKHNPRAHTEYGDIRSYNTNLLANIYLEVRPLSWLTFKTTPSVDASFSRSKNWMPAYDAGVRSKNQASLNENFTEGYTLSLENQVTFNETFGEHNITATAVQHIRKRESNYIDALANGFPYENLNTIIASLEDGRQVSGGYNPFASESYLGRIQYDYQGKYLLNASIRRDGNSRFGPANRWGTFPSLSLAWKLNEDFLTNVNDISLLKLRAGWGMTGNSSIGNFQYQSEIDPFRNFSPVLGEDQSLIPALNVIHSFGNPAIKWEAAEMLNMGIDINFLADKIQFNVDYYIKNQDDLLVKRPMPQAYGRVSGAGDPWVNLGEVQNRGFEFNGLYRKREGDFHYTIGANLTTVKNEVKYIPGELIADNNLTDIGHTIGSFYGYVAERIITPDDFDEETGNYLFAEPASGVPEPGDLMFKDLNNDGIINDRDRTIIGKAIPDFTYSVNLEAMYKGFDLSVFLFGMQNYQVYNHQRAGIEGFSSQDIDHNKLRDFALNYYGAPHPETGEPVPSDQYIRADPSNSNLNDRASTWYLENASFLRLKDLQLGYTLPERISNNLGLNRARIYVSAVNLITITNYTGRDPEAPVRFGDNALSPGNDGGSYPIPRSFTGGIQVDI